MQIINSQYIVIEKPKDRQARYHTLEQDIRCLSAELLRVIKLPFMSEAKRQHILYLDSLIAAYERDQKKLYD